MMQVFNLKIDYHTIFPSQLLELAVLPIIPNDDVYDEEFNL
jgi:hypothetical protein